MRATPPLKVFSQLSHLNDLQWPLLTSTSAVTLPQTSEFGVLNTPSFGGRIRHGLGKCVQTLKESRGSRALVFTSKIKLEDLRSLHLKRLPQRHAARASRSGAERARGGGEGRGGAPPVPRVYGSLDSR